MGHMKLKKIPRRKKFKFIFLITVIYLIFGYTFYYSFNNNKSVMNEEFINFILSNGSISEINDYVIPRVINKTIGYILKIDITKPDSLFNENIIGYSYMEDENSEDLEKLKKISYYMSDPNKVDINNPIVYIYNSHQLENYNNDNLSIYGITPNVLMVSYLLKEKLNAVGISSLVEDTNITEFLELNNWDYSSSYKASRIFMLDKKNTYSSLKYYIDIHRDSAKKKYTTTNINGKNYAKILFVVGMEHDNYQKNLDLANEINNLFDKYYPSLSRGVYKKDGPNVNGIYNQDISSYVMLIEIGGVDNNIDEVVNTINAISHVLSIYINQNEKK